MLVSYSYWGQFLAIKLTVDWRAICILEFIDGTRPPIDYFGDAENLSAEILFGSFGKLHLPFAEANVLPHSNRCCFRETITHLCLSILFHMASTSESVTREDDMPVVE